MSENCTIVKSMFGPFDQTVCGVPAADMLTWVCPVGHFERVPMCADHRAMLGTDVPLWCAACAEAGERHHMAVSS